MVPHQAKKKVKTIPQPEKGNWFEVQGEMICNENHKTWYTTDKSNNTEVKEYNSHTTTITNDSLVNQKGESSKNWVNKAFGNQQKEIPVALISSLVLIKAQQKSNKQCNSVKHHVSSQTNTNENSISEVEEVLTEEVIVKVIG